MTAKVLTERSSLEIICTYEHSDRYRDERAKAHQGALLAYLQPLKELSACLMNTGTTRATHAVTAMGMATDTGMDTGTASARRRTGATSAARSP
ncbi:hypothetical protein GCM10020216_058040 [Nonomuraea helvata]